MAVLQATTLPLEVKVKIPTQPKEGWMGHPLFICLAEFLPGPPAQTKVGHPTVLVMATESQAWATRCTPTACWLKV